MTEFRVGQRVKFENPEAPIVESERDITNTYLRGRIIYVDKPPFLHVIADGKSFAFWLDLRKTEVLPE